MKRWALRCPPPDSGGGTSSLDGLAQQARAPAVPFGHSMLQLRIYLLIFPVAAEVADADPPGLVAVTVARSRKPRSADAAT